MENETEAAVELLKVLGLTDVLGMLPDEQIVQVADTFTKVMKMTDALTH